MKYKLDQVWIAIVLGTLLPPIIGYVGFMSYLESGVSFDISSKWLNNRSLMNAMMSSMQLAGMINLVFFFVFNYLNMFKAMRGTIIGTLIYFVAVFGFNYFR
jgi:hypothetical protein